MNLVGKWKVKELLQFSLENGMEWKPVDEVIDANADEDEEVFDDIEEDDVSDEEL